LVTEVSRMDLLKAREFSEEMDAAGDNRIQAAIDKMNEAYVILDTVF
jgi:hypothetical protein